MFRNHSQQPKQIFETKKMFKVSFFLDQTQILFWSARQDQSNYWNKNQKQNFFLLLLFSQICIVIIIFIDHHHHHHQEQEFHSTIFIYKSFALFYVTIHLFIVIMVVSIHFFDSSNFTILNQMKNLWLRNVNIPCN